ncbi:4-amino-4-deoxy-L-arabinose transferase-like glycosyltransferase [Streptomonospora nanhaiensis]|uniref:4-amino-4-deoxy-L-arabinose transferase-like glycosyltransferase n=1 Tax=Streptomonospora nanhaiensis TaxID=1323731 RepID=A0A853BQK5_9ACTN|nr:glycosyltransferase family 39 protein [Streptomonospora nanhaiensis]NYI97114.1 4-amino-4-deoxy-L-arabinose transferase-like glycosyltransferase [Streptomonospora nanhaiensis]
MSHRTASAPAARATAPPAPPARPPWRRWRPWALAAVCGLAAALYLWGIGGSWGNTYYTAAVKSMSAIWKNFFFGSLDAAGVVTVDKPPMALWLQVASVKLLGFSTVAVQLPQALAGVAAVFLLHRTVRRWAGENAALLAALILALTPITVAINRINNPDTLLVLLVVGAAYAMTRAAEGPRATAWTALAAFLVGCGFLTKMLQAWMVLPAFAAAYLIASRAPWPRRALDLGVAGAVLVASSFWWVALTVLWPAPKPYIGGSTDGSAWDLVFGYNGFGRILGGGAGGSGGGAPQGAAEAAAGTATGAAQGMPGGGGGPGGGFSGQAGLLRMFNEQLAGQISWLLPLCGLVLAAVAASAVLRRRAGRPLDRRGAAGWVLWGGWLVVGLVLSFAQGTMHPYYTTMLAPAIAAVAGAGLVRFWGWYRRPAGRAWPLLPLAVLTTAAWSSAVVWRTPEWHVWAGYLELGLAAAAVVLLVAQRFGGRRGLARAALALGLAAVLAVPAAWSGLAAAVASGAMNGTNPMAGPADSMGGPGGMGGGPDGGAQGGDSEGGMPSGGAAGRPAAGPGAAGRGPGRGHGLRRVGHAGRAGRRRGVADRRAAPDAGLCRGERGRRRGPARGGGRRHERDVLHHRLRPGGGGYGRVHRIRRRALRRAARPVEGVGRARVRPARRGNGRRCSGRRDRRHRRIRRRGHRRHHRIERGGRCGRHRAGRPRADGRQRAPGVGPAELRPGGRLGLGRIRRQRPPALRLRLSQGPAPRRGRHPMPSGRRPPPRSVGVWARTAHLRRSSPCRHADTSPWRFGATLKAASTPGSASGARPSAAVGSPTIGGAPGPRPERRPPEWKWKRSTARAAPAATMP